MHKYFVESNEWLTPSTLLITLNKDPEETRLFSFQPGQYAAISFKRRGRPTPARCFSIVSSPTDQSKLQFSMRSRGHFTKALSNIKEGDEVSVRGPFGGFVLDVQRDTDAVLLAGGIGITPFISMIRYVTDVGHTNNITLVYSSQNQDDVPFVRELMELEKQNPHFKVIFVISDGDTSKLAGAKVVLGRISPEIIDDVSSNNNEKINYFLCGPPPFMKGMSKVLKDKGVSNDRIMTEAFSQGPNKQTGKIRSWPFNIYVLGALGVVIGSSVVMLSDLLKTLPPSSVLGSANKNKLTSPTNSRQTDLDKLVNDLPDLANTNPATDAASKAMSQADINTTPATQPAKTNTTTPSKTPTVAKPAPTTTTPAPKPAPPTPKCTTSQSGVTTCL